ncbi:hypothetical protein [Marininema halotolerans]|uniref:Uncharacterized protein n=1 Tax=Marininema halotolerans TaxID=1155944 RepID=A0A1I6UF69_9BACL|nr:hypothetical protein [Marininema halotolerans]SFT00061.1 hypothetical protein SAMN05444972_11618 [Marininema halotolerans]
MFQICIRGIKIQSITDVGSLNIGTTLNFLVKRPEPSEGGGGQQPGVPPKPPQSGNPLPGEGNSPPTNHPKPPKGRLPEQDQSEV